MEKREVMNVIKEIVYKITGIKIEDENDNIIGCHHNYPIIYAIYIVDELEKYLVMRFQIYLLKMIILFGNYQIWQRLL